MAKKAQKQQYQGKAAKTVGSFFRKFHLTLFFVIIIACLAGAVMLVNQVLTQSAADDAYTSSINAGSIDQATLVRVQALHQSSKNQPAPALPAGRVNPFAE